jgi:hypothetical protein
MNRIILIGNGFDLAHGLKTSYRDFIDDFWERQIARIKEEYDDRKEHPVDNEVVLISYENPDVMVFREHDIDIVNNEELSRILRREGMQLNIQNYFLRQITKEKSIKNWVDIEDEYFNLLAKCYAENEKKGKKVPYTIKKLNEEFEYIRNELINYLTEKNEKPSMIQGICEGLFSMIDFRDIYPKYLYELAESCCRNTPSYLMLERRNYTEYKKKELINYEMKAMITRKDEFPNGLLFLSLNYTETETLYTKEFKEVKAHVQAIHIHGELANPNNPIIFGFGDEN